MAFNYITGKNTVRGRCSFSLFSRKRIGWYEVIEYAWSSRCCCGHPGHAGDFPPLLMYKGDACLAVRTARFRVKDIIGRTVVIHNGADDFHTQPAGNAGIKIGCGVIKETRKPCKVCAQRV